MRKHLLLISFIALLMSAGCDKIKSDISQTTDVLKKAVEENGKIVSALEEACKEANQEVSKLKATLEAIEIEDYITSVTPIVREGVTVGYTLTFFRSGDMMIFNGTDGHSPEMGVKKYSDGELYWTLDGQLYLNASGNRVKATGKDGITPQLRINSDSYWEISFDNGSSWVQSGKAIGSDGLSFFKDVTFSDDDVLFTLQDGTQFSVPAFHGLDMKIDAKDGIAGAIPGSTVNIGFSVEGLADKSGLIISSDGNYAAKVDWSSSSEGTLIVTCPDPFVEGYINVLATDGNGYSAARTIQFIENKIEFPQGSDYCFSCDGGNATIPFKTNFEWFHKVQEGASSWLTVSVANDSEYALNLSAERNLKTQSREATIQIFAKANPDLPIASIKVTQEAAFFELDRLCYAIPAKGESVKIDIKSSYKIAPKVASGIDWVQADAVETGTHQYRMTLRVSENTTESRRNTNVEIVGDGKALATLKVIQLSRNEDEQDDMVFEVAANYVNNFTTCLPLCNKIDCIVDWGDQTVDYYYHDRLDASNPEFLISHKYKVAAPTTFKVRISGQVEGLQSTKSNIDCASIKKVVQWGNVGLKYMLKAFADNSMLESVAGDTRGAFKNVGDFSSAFSYCISLHEVSPQLFDKAVNASTMFRVFESCNQLETVPEYLFSKCSSLRDASSIFLNCRNFRIAPEHLFANCTSIVDAGFIFSGCSSLTTVPSTLFEGCTAINYVGSLFQACTSLKTIPAGLLSSCTQISNASNMFGVCTALTDIPDDLFSNCPNLTDINNVFRICGSLKNISPMIFDNNRKLVNVAYAFNDCKRLVSECPYSIIDGKKVYLYERYKYPEHFKTPEIFAGCFLKCTKMSGYEYIPDNWKTQE